LQDHVHRSIGNDKDLHIFSRSNLPTHSNNNDRNYGDVGGADGGKALQISQSVFQSTKLPYLKSSSFLYDAYQNDEFNLQIRKLRDQLFLDRSSS
jgi:hypothetical protein